MGTKGNEYYFELAGTSNNQSSSYWGLTVLRLLWITSFVWDSELVEHVLVLVCNSVDCYR